MTNRIRHLITTLCLFATIALHAQPVNQVFQNSGIWQDYGVSLSPNSYPKFKGRLVNCAWADIEVANNVWNWSVFDQDIKDHVSDNMPVIFMVYTRMSAPDWIFTNGGVPKVTETSSTGDYVGYSPYYLNDNYNFYFKRMITEVRKHVESMDPSLRNLIIGVQACFGSTGDQISYKGNVAPQYQISTTQFDSLFKVYSSYYYNEYKATSPAITMLSNPNNDKPDQQYWLDVNCPNGWTKCGTLPKGSQQNGELDMQGWLYDILNKPVNGNYIKARGEIVGSQLSAGWWTKNKYKEMFAIMTYCVYWGLDWPNETSGFIQDANFDSSFRFFNKYAGQKVPGLATNAVCALKDALDASDSVRFPVSQYGAVLQSNKTRFNNIYKAYSPYGAKLEDIDAQMGNEYLGFTANGTNDVGWRLLPGNYERYLHQIDANATSIGYWNVDDAHNSSMYGRFARGFDLANGKDALYFDVEDAFLNNAPLKQKYPVTIDVTYYDQGTGSWKIYYDGIGNKNKATNQITCTDSKTWKKATFVITDANFANKSTRNSDFYIKNSGSSNVIFSVVELSRATPNAASFTTTPLSSFDTACLSSATTAKSFVLNAASLDGSTVKVGPLKGYIFSTKADSDFNSSLSFNNYGNALNYTIYVKINTDTAGNYTGKIPVTGGGLAKAIVKVAGSVLSTSPLLNPNVTSISCYNNKDGAIALKPQGGIGPFTYAWAKTARNGWSDSGENISNLSVDNYTVTITSYKGCVMSKTYAIVQPQPLAIQSITQDSNIVCRGGSTTVQVTAAGGTLPYTGTGSYVVPAGFKIYYVSDAKGCQTQTNYTVSAGTLTTPAKPDGITGPSSIQSKQTTLSYSVVNPVKDYTYSWSVPSDAVITSGQNTSTVTVVWGATTGNITVQSLNKCGSSNGSTALKVKVTNGLNAVAANLPGGNASNGSVVIMPNPVKDIATLRFNADNTWNYSINVSDVSGKTLLMKKGKATTGDNTEKLNVQNFASGTYLVTITNDAGERKTVRMIKD